MLSAVTGRRLEGCEIHGFRTMEDLDIHSIMEEAQARWLRPNEIHAMLSNYKYFNINVKPVNLPKSGTIVWFDRKVLRNFRKDGHNWKKKKDGKTVKEAHEHLKVGNEERLHVYYAHGEDKPTFVRRCYWLLDKKLEHIVLVHYRETQELQGSPDTSGNSNSSSALSAPSASWILSEEFDSVLDRASHTSEGAQLGPNDRMIIKSHEMRLHEINTLEWDELLVPDDLNTLVAPEEGRISCFEQRNGDGRNLYMSNSNSSSAKKLQEEDYLQNFPEQVAGSNTIHFNIQDNVGFNSAGGQMNPNFQGKESEVLTVGVADSLDNLVKDGLQTQDSFGRWMNYIMTESPGLVDDPIMEPSLSTGHETSTPPIMDHPQSSVLEQIISITDVSPAWALSTEETKIIVVGFFREGHPDLAKSNLLCVCGDACKPAEVIQTGVFRCLISPQNPGLVNLYLSLDGHNPISQVLTFEFCAPLTRSWMMSSENKSDLENFRIKMRLAHLLFSASKSLDILSGKVSQKALKEAKTFVRKTSHVAPSWENLIKSIEDNKISFLQAKDSLFELTLQNRLQEWLLERVVAGFKISDLDEQGQGVIHLCAILGYTWAAYPFSCSSLSLDFRDKFGWTALHWAAYFGREKMVAALLSAGAKPNLVTHPTSKNPGGSTAADLASKNGYDGLAAYLAEKGLVKQFEEMTIAGNASGSLQTSVPDLVNPGNFSKEDPYLKDTLAAYRTAADAAAHIHAAFRERSFKLQTNAVEVSNPEDEARIIVAAMRIQHAFRNYDTRKKIAAAARIQHRFRTWKIRRDYLNMRRQAIKIQAVFRGFQVRKQYRKIIWSVGVLEKVILRWHLKRKGLRGLQVPPGEAVKDQKQENEVEEDFFVASRKQAEARIESSVVRVQALFRSKKAQEEYQRMKLEHDKATLEYEGLLDPDIDMQ
ncbi:unnamed protein product [Ilex paraguariensis]|uniref:CG-1 domain-containing protein n=1 Tax=Ilex paraguariensis TaxID=185542 RepID=A0ABC8RMG8_9AQUA